LVTKTSSNDPKKMPPLTPEQIAGITAAVHDNFDAQIKYTQRLIQFGGQRGEEAAVQDFVFQQYTDRGYAPVKFDMDEAALGQHVGAGKFSATHSRAPVVVGTHKPRGTAEGGKSLILNGHIDVVPLGPTDMWADDPYSAKIVGDKMYGRGAGDMRSGHAANLFALDALKKAGWQPASEVILQSVPEEESTGNGTLMTHVKGYKADAVLIPEPVQEQLVRANVGVLWFQIEVRGRPVHVRAMGTGVNAIDACWGVVGALRGLEKEWNERHVSARYFENEQHPLSKSWLCHSQWPSRVSDSPSSTDLNVAIVNAGDWASSVPAWCRIDCRIAIVPGVKAAEASAEIEKCVADFAANDAYLRENTPKVTWNGFFAEGYELAPGSEAEQVLMKAHKEATGKDLTYQTSTAYLDARVHSLYDKVPALVYGPISGDIHGFDEWVSVESIKKVTVAMALFIAEWCGVEKI
jgi:acetylornithine deacetylase